MLDKILTLHVFFLELVYILIMVHNSYFHHAKPNNFQSTCTYFAVLARIQVLQKTHQNFQIDKYCVTHFVSKFYY